MVRCADNGVNRGLILRRQTAAATGSGGGRRRRRAAAAGGGGDDSEECSMLPRGSLTDVNVAQQARALLSGEDNGRGKKMSDSSIERHSI
jgi:hypothetical protein